MAKTKKMSAFRKKATAVLARAGRSKRPRAATVFQKTFSGSEVKYQDTVVQVEFDTTGNPTLINGVAEGNENTNRAGRQFKIVSIMAKGYVTGASASGPAGATPIRQLVVYDKQTNGAAPVIGDVLVNGDVAGQLNMDNKNRFVVLWDEIWQPPGIPLGTNGAGAAYWSVNKWRKVNLPVLNKGTTAAVASIATGSIYVFSIGAFAANATHNPVSQINYRIKFTDD